MTGTCTQFNQSLLHFIESKEIVHIGFAQVDSLTRGKKALKSWLDKGYQGEMKYMESPTRHSTENLLDNTQTIIAVAIQYARNQNQLEILQPMQPFIARYARGKDYHHVLKRVLFEVKEYIITLTEQHLGCCIENPKEGGEHQHRVVVDTAPLLEREVLERAGLGSIAKNTLLITPGLGSYTLLGEILTTLNIGDIQPVIPKNICGDCTQCISACPTGAIVSPYVVDARKCISYLTIEYKGIIPVEHRKAMGQMVFGCDICQEVCPYNSKERLDFKPLQLSKEESERAHKGQDYLTLPQMLHLGSSHYRKFVKGRALNRATRHQLARNAVVAMGNEKNPEVIPIYIKSIEEYLTNKPHKLVVEHAEWALGELKQV